LRKYGNIKGVHVEEINMYKRLDFKKQELLTNVGYMMRRMDTIEHYFSTTKGYIKLIDDLIL